MYCDRTPDPVTVLMSCPPLFRAGVLGNLSSLEVLDLSYNVLQAGLGIPIQIRFFKL